MTDLWTKPVTRVWIALMAITCVTTWGLTERHVPLVIGTVGVVVLASVKIGLVMQWFMELRDAPVPWQAYFGAWIVVVTAVILGSYAVT